MRSLHHGHFQERTAAGAARNGNGFTPFRRSHERSSSMPKCPDPSGNYRVVNFGVSNQRKKELRRFPLYVEHRLREWVRQTRNSRYNPGREDRTMIKFAPAVTIL